MNRFRRHFVNHYPLIKEPYSNTLYIIVTIAFMFLAGCSSRQETTMTKAPQFDRGKFEALYRAGKAVDASIAVSVTREKFRELVQAFATETSIARDKATVSDEKGLVESFSDALAAYHDSLQLWDAQIKQQLEFSQKNAILCFGEISPIAARNGLPCIESNTAGITVIPNESIQFLWIVAGVRLRKASALFLADQSLQANQDLDQIKKAFYRPLLEEIQANRDERDRRLAREAADRRQREAKAAKDLEIRNKLIKQAEQFYRQGFDYAGPETTVFHPDRADGYYHEIDCPIVAPPNRNLTDLRSATEQGLKPHDKCKPPIWNPSPLAALSPKEVYIDANGGTIYHYKMSCPRLPTGHRQGIFLRDAKRKFQPCPECVPARQ